MTGLGKGMTFLKNTQGLAIDIAQLSECLPSMYEVLGSTPQLYIKNLA